MIEDSYSALPPKDSRKYDSFITRLLNNYIPEPNSGCWLWTAFINDNGYGKIGYGRCPEGKGSIEFPAHRSMYEYTHGPIPKELTVDHLCRVRCCVNPEHLEIVSNKVNILRGTGPTALNAVKTHCPQGHSYSGSNLWIRKTGRYCRACCKAYKRAYRAKHRKGARV